MNEFFSDFLGVIGSPAQTVGKMMEKKRWQAVLASILLLTAVATFLTYPITKVEQAKFIRDSAMADKLSEEQLANLDRFTPTQRLTSAMFSLVFVGMMIVVAAFFVYLFFKVAGCEGNYVHYFSGVVHASILDMFLGGILKTSLILMKKTMLVHTGLTMFFPALDFRSLPSIVLSQFDFFSIWYLAVLALGIAAFAKISPQKSLFIAFLYFLFKSLVFVSFSYFSLKIMGM